MTSLPDLNQSQNLQIIVGTALSSSVLLIWPRPLLTYTVTKAIPEPVGEENKRIR